MNSTGFLVARGDRKGRDGVNPSSTHLSVLADLPEFSLMDGATGINACVNHNETGTAQRQGKS